MPRPIIWGIAGLVALLLEGREGEREKEEGNVGGKGKGEMRTYASNHRDHSRNDPHCEHGLMRVFDDVRVCDCGWWLGHGCLDFIVVLQSQTG